MDINSIMKSIQITVDERLLHSLDTFSETRRRGRSAVIRAALGSYLKARRSREIDEAIRIGYRKTPKDKDLLGWEDEGTWPDE
jgi:metal-responsive CopG/Arc/MetJ family transcriptional regulator